MRIPLFFVIPLAICTIAITWWQGAKGKDFLTPPPSAVLAIEQRNLKQEKLQASLDLQNNKDLEPTKAIRVKPGQMPSIDTTLAIEEPKSEEEIIELGDLTRSPGLDAYTQFSEKGASYFIKLATLLETSGELQRTLLAWERVADSASPDAPQRKLTTDAIARLRPQLPAWIVDPTARTTIIIHAGCDTESATIVKPALKEIAALLSEHSSGIIHFKDDVSVGATASPSPLPIALWFSSGTDPSHMSRTITIPSGVTDAAQMSQSLARSLYKIFREEIGSQGSLQAPVPLDPTTTDASSLFQNSVTRRHWHAFSKRLSKIP